jgi:hypothetical protein
MEVTWGLLLSSHCVRCVVVGGKLCDAMTHPIVNPLRVMIELLTSLRLAGSR